MLPQYHASLTQRIEYKESHICNVCRCIDGIVFAKFEGFSTFLYVFPTEDWSIERLPPRLPSTSSTSCFVAGLHRVT